MKHKNRLIFLRKKLPQALKLWIIWKEVNAHRKNIAKYFHMYYDGLYQTQMKIKALQNDIPS